MTTMYGLHYSNAELEHFLSSRHFSNALYLVTESMDESLVVLASRLHWKLEDVLYVTVHDSCVDQETTVTSVYCSKDLRRAVKHESKRV